MKNEADLMQWLPSIALFGGLEEATLKRIVSLLKEHRCEPHAALCKQGETGRSMFLVRHGEVIVYRDDERGHRLKMIRLGPGEFFGEMTLIDIQKRSATVEAQKPSLLFSLSNRDLYTLYQEDVAGYVMVLQNLCRELSRRLRATNQRLHSMATEHDDAEKTLISHAAIKE